jgi:hypothetical protein
MSVEKFTGLNMKQPVSFMFEGGASLTLAPGESYITVESAIFMLESVKHDLITRARGMK